MQIHTAAILIAITWLSAPFVQAQDAQGPASQQGNNAPVAFKFGVSYILRTSSYVSKDFARSRNVIDLNIRNDDPARTVIELEYEVYATDKKGDAEIAQVRLVDRVKIKPGKTTNRWSVPWKPDSILEKCSPPFDCRINLRIVRVKFDSGDDFTGQVEAQKPTPSKTPGKARDAHPLP